MSKLKMWWAGFLSALLVFFGLNGPLLAEAKENRLKIALIPFENLSGQFGADEAIMAGLSEVLQEGFILAPKTHVEYVLTDLRIRHTGNPTSAEVKKIGRRLKVDALLLGLIETYRREPFPQLSFFCKFVSTKDESSLIWAKNFCARGRQTMYLLQSTKHTDWPSLLRSTAEELLRSLPKNIEDKKISDKGERTREVKTP